MKRLRTLTVRMIINHVLVTTLGSVIATLAFVLLLINTVNTVSAADFKVYATYGGLAWLFGETDWQPNLTDMNVSAGFSLIVSPDNKILLSQGDTTCRVGMVLAECEPEVLNSPEGERFFQLNGERWAEVVVKTVLGQRAITRRGPPPTAPCILLGSLTSCSVSRFVEITTGSIALFSLPLALFLGWFSARPLIRRLSTIATVSERFADGDFTARVHDRHDDEVGHLAHQVDKMADALEHNVGALRDLAQRNAELMRQAEQSAIQAERARLSRDLHDAIAQRLFSLSISTSTLPDIITRDPAKGVEQALIIASLSEQTLLDLRTLLVELRPTNVIQRGLTEALNKACEEWSAVHHIALDCSIMLSGKYLASGVEDTIYRILQEALSNIAKHAEATSAVVSLVEGQRKITLSITDNGHGFNSTAVTGNGKFGFMSMQERARALGGSVVVESDTTHGTTVRLTLPIEVDASCLSAS